MKHPSSAGGGVRRLAVMALQDGSVVHGASIAAIAPSSGAVDFSTAMAS